MGNTLTSNDKTVADDAKVKLIIGEIGRDTQTGIIGRGYSFDNGNTFHVTDTIYGRLYTQNDADGLWNNGLHEKVKEKVNQEITNTVEPAIKQADSAVAYANEAIEKSRVNSQAIVEINSAVSDAVSDAVVARSDGLRAWNAAQSNVNLIDSNYASASAAILNARTEAIAAADEAKASASAAQADIVAVRSDVAAVQADVTATRSDVAIAKSDIADTKTNLTSQAKSLSSYAAQASAVGKDITTLKSQARQFEQDMADTKGNVSQLKVSASSASVALSDAAGDINKIQTDATGTKQTLTNAKSDIAVLQSRADGFDTKYANAAGDINTLKVDASGMKQTLTDAKGDISTLQSTATGFKNTLTDAQGNISTLQSDVSGLKKTTSDHAGNIATLQADAKTLTSQMSSAQGDISTLKQTASGFSSKVSGIETSLANANSKINDITSNGGGRNLLQGTGTASGDVANGGVGNYIIKGAFNGYDAIKTNTAWDERCINLYSALGRTNAKAGDWFTISVYVKADKQINTGALGVFRALGNGDANTNDGFLGYIMMSNKPITTKWQQYAWSFQINDISLQRQTTRVEYNHDTGDNWIYWAGWMLEKGTVAHDWQPAPEDTDAKITTNTAAIEQNKKAIALKADQTTVDKTNGTVQQLQSQLKVQADQIASKVSSSDLDAKGYATQTYTQTQIKQTSDSWNANLTSFKNGLTDKYTNLHATVDGIQAQVYNSDGSSKITQLSNLIATKVSQGDYNSQITQLKDDINLRVAKGNVVSQINQEAGGNTLIQVSNGKGKLALNASSVIFSGSAFIPDAYISTLNADKLRFYDSSGNVATMSAGLKQYDDDKTNHTVTLQYSGGYEVHASNLLGSILTMHDNSIRLAVKANGMASSGSNDQYSGVYVTTHYAQLSNYRSDGKSPGIYIGDDGFTIKGDDSGVGTKWGDLNVTTPQLYLTGTNKCQINGSNSQVTLANNWSMVHANNDLWLETKSSQIHLGDNIVDIANKNNSNTSNYDVHLTLRGYVNMTGWLTCMGLTQTSRLSTKTRIEPLDTAKALELINSADVATYQYKQEVAHGGTKRHASVIIDDVHDVAQYQTPDEFISEDRQGRSDGDIVGYLMGAVQELTKRLKTLESKVG